MLLLNLKAVTSSKSQLMACTVCASATPHSMRYKILRCACKQGKAVAPFAKCSWWAKMLDCQEGKTVSLGELGSRFSPANPRKKPMVTRAQRVFIQSMTRENLTPLRILHAMTKKFELGLQELPELRKVQNAVSHYRITKLEGTDRAGDVASHVSAASFTGYESDHEPFTFTRSVDATGKCLVGDGSDARPFVVGVTTKALLRSADRDPATCILHVDATFQLDQVGYPVIVCGLSDGARGFHLLALFVTSQLEERHFTDAFVAHQAVFAQMAGKQMDVRYFMADADKAQFNAVAAVFGSVCSYKYLMCFYHVIAKVRLALKKRARGLHGDAVAAVNRELYDLHFAVTDEEYLVLKEQVPFQWVQLPALDVFRKYMTKQWFQGIFSRWQCYHSPPGFATTNNPCETFNRAFKRNYTQKRKLKLALLIQQMRDYCSHSSMSALPFLPKRVSDQSLDTRATALLRAGFLREHVHERSRIGFLIENSSADVVRVLAAQPPRFYVPSRGRSEEALDVAAKFSVNYSRTEVEGQPSDGWPVDVKTGFCPCRYRAKISCCVHLLFALRVRNFVDGTGERLMVNRSRKRRCEDDDGERFEACTRGAGRPTNAGHALQKH